MRIYEELPIMDNDHVVLNVHIEAAAGQEDKLAEQLPRPCGAHPQRAGMSAYELHRDTQNPAKFMFCERFRSQAALDEHLASTYFKKFVAYRASGNPDPIASIVITTWRSIA